MSDGINDAPKDKAAERWKQIEQFLENQNVIKNADVHQLCGVSAATANHILAKLTTEGKLVKCRTGGHWTYRRMEIVSGVPGTMPNAATVLFWTRTWIPDGGMSFTM